MMKKRLTGAIVLVILAIIFVPMILDDRGPKIELVPLIPEQPQEANREELIPGEETTHINQVDLGDKQRYELPVGEVMQNTESVLEPTPPIEEVSPAEQAPEPVVEVKPDPKPVPYVPSAGEVVKQGWVIQAGSFGDRANAEKLVKQLAASGRSVFIEPIDAQGKSLHRVRIGPIAERAVADQELLAVERDFQVKGKVLAFP